MFGQSILRENRQEERLAWGKGYILVLLPCYLVESVWFSILVQGHIKIKIEMSTRINVVKSKVSVQSS